MKFPLDGICAIEELIAITPCPWEYGSGRIYLIEMNNLVKIGKSERIEDRARSHKMTARSYGVEIGRCAYSKQIASARVIESAFHRAAARFRKAGCTEMYCASIEDLMEVFDIDYKLALVRDLEEEKRKQDALIQMSLSRKQQHRESKEKREARLINTIMERIKCEMK